MKSFFDLQILSSLFAFSVSLIGFIFIFTSVRRRELASKNNVKDWCFLSLFSVFIIIFCIVCIANYLFSRRLILCCNGIMIGYTLGLFSYYFSLERKDDSHV